MDPLGTGFTAPDADKTSSGFVAPTHERLDSAPFTAPPHEQLGSSSSPGASMVRDQTTPAGGVPTWMSEAEGEIKAREAGHQLVQTAPGRYTVQQGEGTPLSAEEKIALYNAHAAKAGVPHEEYGQMMADRAAQAQQQQAAGQSGYQNFANAGTQGLARFGTNIVGAVAPQTATNLQQNVAASAPYNPETPSGFAGEFVGNTLPLVPAMLNPELGLATGVAAGAGQAGAVRQDVAHRRAGGQDISKLKEFTDAGMQAATMFLVQRASLGRLGRPVGPLSDAERQSLLNLVEHHVATYARNAGVQGADFMSMQVANNVVDKLTGVAPEKNYLEGAGQAALTGLAQGAVGTALHGTSQGTSPAPRPVPVPSAETVESLKTAPHEVPNERPNIPQSVESQPAAEAPVHQQQAAPVENGNQPVPGAEPKAQARPLLEQANPKFRVTQGAESRGVPLEFESPEEKALYLATVPRKGKVAVEAAAYLAEKGYKPDDVTRYADELRERITGLAKQPPAEGHPLHVPMLGEEEAQTSAEAGPEPVSKDVPAQVEAKAEKVPEPQQLLPEKSAKQRDERDALLYSAMPEARVVKSGLSADHQEVLNVHKELTGQEAIPYMGGRGRGFRANGRTFYSVEKNNTPQLRREAIAHEATHALQDTRPDLVAKLDRAIPENTKAKLLSEYQDMYRNQEGKTLSTEQHAKEIQAMAVGRAFSRPSVARQVMQNNPGAFTKAADTIITKLRGLTSGGRVANEVVAFLRQAREEAAKQPQSDERRQREKDVENFLPEPHDRIRDEAEKYSLENKIPYQPHNNDYAKVDEGKAGRIAAAYGELQHNPSDPVVKKSYDAFKKETLDQYEFLKKQGVKFEPWKGEGQPYKDSADMMKDARDNKHLYFFQGGGLPTDHPLAANAPGTPYTYNGIFRAVHDYFGHAKEGVGFGPRGEENAWRAHSQMFSEEARPAMTTETRGQNSWVNYGPHGEHNQANPNDTIYAEQKAGLLPAEFQHAGSEPGTPAPQFLPGAKAAKTFVSEDIAPKLKELGQNVKDAFDGVQNFFGLQSGKGAEQTKDILRERGSELAQRYDRLNEAFGKTKEWFDANMTQAEKYGFIDQMERGPQASTAALQPVQDALRAVLDDRLKQLQGHGKLQQFVMDYFPHLWKDPKKASAAFNDMAKRPFEGTKGFLRQRTLPLFMDGVAKGLEPITDNPVEAVMMRVRQMDKYITAQDALTDLHGRGLLQKIPARGVVPEGYTEIDDPIGKVYAPPNRRGGLSIAARWVAPDSVASVINNYLSPGLRGNEAVGGAFRTYLGVGNLMNQVQLGLSGFHALATSFNSVIGKTALGLKQAAEGNFKEAGKAIASAPIAVGQDIYNGSKMLREWKTPGSTDPETAAAVKFLKQAGGRAGQDEFYTTGAAAKFMEALRKGNPIGAAMRLPTAALDVTGKPLMEWFVPRMKLGAFMDMARFEMQKLGPNASIDDQRAAAHKAWDSIDNRFGQLVYDNLFWNKSAKDMAMASMRSVGWNLGTFRELGGAVKDLGTAGKRLALDRSMDKVELTHRMAYAVSLPIVTGLIGGAIHYMLNGKHPDDLKDYYFPRTGEKDKEGHDVRLALPTYMKDVYAFKQNPVATVTHKVHPMFNTIMEMLANKDYYGTKIRNEDDPILKQAADLAKHAGESFQPFGVREVKKLHDEGQGVRSALPLLGITQARRDITNSPAELQAAELMQARMPRGARTQEEANKSKLEGELRGELNRNEPDAIAKMRAAVEGGKITREEAMQVRANAKYKSALERNVHHLDMHDAMKVWDVATDQEKKKLGSILLAKLRGSKSLSVTERKQYMKTLMADVQRLQAPTGDSDGPE